MFGKHSTPATTVAALIICLAVLPTLDISAADSLLINYQGRLTDDAGNPVPDDNYSITFSLWDSLTSGNFLWYETHPSVTTTAGLFNVILGSKYTLNESVFETDPLFLQIRIGYEILEPRAQLTSVPSAAYAKKVIGDIETGDGSLSLNSSDGAPAVTITAEGKGAPAYLRMYNPNPLFPEQTLLEMSSESEGSSIELFPAEDYNDPFIRMGFDPTPFTTGKLDFFEPAGTRPTDPYISMGVDPSPFAGGKLELYDPGSGWFYNPMIRMGTEPSPFHKASVEMYNPQPEEPTKILEMSASETAVPGEWGSSLMMYTGPEYPAGDMLFELTANPTDGARMNLYNEVAKYMGLEPMPFNTGGAMRLYGSSGGVASLQLELTSNATSGAKINLYNEIAQYMGVEPVPFNTGGIMKLYGCSGGMASLQMELMSSAIDGAGINIYDDLGKRMGLDPSPFNTGYSMNMYDPASTQPDSPILSLSSTSGSGASIYMATPLPEPPPKALELSVSQDAGEWGGFFDMYSMDPGDLGAMAFQISNTASTGAKMTLYNALPGKRSNAVVEISYDSANGGGKVMCYSEPDASTATLTGRDLAFNDGISTNVYINYGGASYFGGYMGLGAFPPENILHVQQNSATDPIADAWTIYSSRRWKKNVTPIEGALGKVLALRGVAFDWKSDDRHDIGLIAEEVGEVVPEVVAYEEDSDAARSVDYGRLVAVMVEAIKEQQRQIDDLTALVEKLLAQRNPGSDNLTATE